MGLFPLASTAGLAGAQGRVVLAPCAALGALLGLSDEDWGDTRDAVQGGWWVWQRCTARRSLTDNPACLAIFPSLLCLHKLRFPRKCRYRLRPALPVFWHDPSRFLGRETILRALQISEKSHF